MQMPKKTKKELEIEYVEVVDENMDLKAEVNRLREKKNEYRKRLIASEDRCLQAYDEQNKLLTNLVLHLTSKPITVVRKNHDGEKETEERWEKAQRLDCLNHVSNY